MLNQKTLLICSLVVLVFAGFGCQKGPAVDPLEIERENARPFRELEGKQLILDLSEEEVVAGQEDGLILVAATRMGVAFSYNPEQHTVGSVGHDINVDDLSPLETEEQFIALMDQETLGEGEEGEEYAIIFKNFFLNNGSYSVVEKTFSNDVASFKEIELDGVSGREYRVVGEEGFHLVFPRNQMTSLNIQILDEKVWNDIESTVHLPSVQ